MMVALVNLRYPYGARQIFLPLPLISVASRLAALGHRMKLIDFNIDEYTPTLFEDCGKVGVSLLGPPYILAAKGFVQRLQSDFPGQEVAIGGQVVEHISRGGFAKIFHGLPVKQIVDDNDFADWIGASPDALPHPMDVSCIPGWEQLEDEQFQLYLQHEIAGEVSQGCRHGCKFCAAHKRQQEQLKDITVFEADQRFVAEKAKSFGLRILWVYATALDFFQNASEKVGMLEIWAKIRRETGIDIRVRCLTCKSSFLAAAKSIPNFGRSIKEAEIWCIGLGEDNVEKAWEREGKRHNRVPLEECLKLCRLFGIKAEVLNVFGFPKDSFSMLWKTFRRCVRWGLMPGTMLRPYLGKSPIPGNDYWPEWEKIFTEDPEKFMALDYLALQSKILDPSFFHRWACNLAYLAIIGLLYPLGKCSSIFLFPPEYGVMAKMVNRLMPADR